MIDVTLKFLGVGYNNIYQPFIMVYDDANCEVYNGNTFNGKINLHLKNQKFYKVIAFFCGEKICKTFFINGNNTYSFSFNHSLYYPSNPNQNIINLSLTDYFYKNLPIEKGEMIFWQNP